MIAIYIIFRFSFKDFFEQNPCADNFMLERSVMEVVKLLRCVKGVFQPLTFACIAEIAEFWFNLCCLSIFSGEFINEI